MRGHFGIAAVFVMLAAAAYGATPQPYRNFKVTVYIPAQVVDRMGEDPAWMETSWRTIGLRLHVDQVFIESYRAGVSVGDATLARVKSFFLSKGVAVAGGMAMLGPGRGGQFHTLDYALTADRSLARQMSERTARHFDEFVLDDLYFYNTKSDADIAAKGRRTWAEYRMQTMDEVSRDLILEPAIAANPKVRVIIKFPNFYPSFQGMGFDLKHEPEIFPEIWTGDETRFAPTTDQQLPPYESYEIFRYFENIAPGRNGGGWVDPIAMRFLDRYAEQLWDTILAKAPAINLFEYTDLLTIADPSNRDAWRYLPTTFDYARMLRECCGIPGAPGSTDARLADVVDYSLRSIDRVAGSLGAPVALATYRPVDSSGEDFLPEVAGMIGIPMEMYPRWPQAQTVFLTEASKTDPDIVRKIEAHVRDGGRVVITSGLLQALQDHGFDQITDMRVTGHLAAPTEYVEGEGFGAGNVIGTSPPILFPLIHFYTNEDWAVVRGLDDGGGVPLLLVDHYGKGDLYVLTIPEEQNDFYSLPPRVLDAIRRYLTSDLPVRIEGPAKVSLFEYDNGTFVVESYRDDPVDVRAVGGLPRVENLATGVTFDGDPLPPSAAPRPDSGSSSARNPAPRYGYDIRIEPHSVVAFRGKP